MPFSSLRTSVRTRRTPPYRHLPGRWRAVCPVSRPGTTFPGNRTDGPDVDTISTENRNPARERGPADALEGGAPWES